MERILLGTTFSFLMEGKFPFQFLIMIESGGLLNKEIKIGAIITYTPAKLTGIISKVEGHLLYICWLNHVVLAFNEVAIFPTKQIIDNDKWKII